MRFGFVPRLAAAVAGGILATLACACTAHKQPSKVETALANMAKDVVIPLEAESRTNPQPATAEVIEQGRQAYLQSCAMCHGVDGHAATDLGRSMYPPAMDMTSPHVQHWTDAELFWIIQNGVRLTGMPSWKSVVTAEDTWKMARFIHSLSHLPAAVQDVKVPVPQKENIDPVTYGKTLYRQEGCFTCHQLNGEGGKVGPDLTTEGKRGRTAEWLVGHFKNPPAYVKGSIMPAFQNLTDEQLKALTEFLLSQKGQAR